MLHHQIGNPEIPVFAIENSKTVSQGTYPLLILTALIVLVVGTVYSLSINNNPIDEKN